jgi:hypothetical protein
MCLATAADMRQTGFQGRLMRCANNISQDTMVTYQDLSVRILIHSHLQNAPRLQLAGECLEVMMLHQRSDLCQLRSKSTQIRIIEESVRYFFKISFM